MLNAAFLSTLHPPKTYTYRWPIFLAILLHVLFFGLLFSHFSFDQANSYTQTQTVQANLVSNAQLAAMMKTVPTPVPPRPQPAVKPTSPMPSAPQKPAPTIPMHTPEMTTQKTAPIKTQHKPVQQKSLEESLLQTELNKTEKPNSKKLHNTTEEQLMAEQLQAEASNAQTPAHTASKQNSATTGEINQYKALILQQIQQNWIMPTKTENLSCILQIQLAPGGMVLNVSVLKSSGNEALDRSAIAAVNKSSPLPVPKDSEAFSAFRSFTLTVKPEDPPGALA